MFEKKHNYHKPARSVVQQRESKINHLMSYYQVPAGLDKDAILKNLLTKIEEENTKQQGTSKIFFLSPVYRIAISTAAFLLLIFLLQFFLSTIRVNSEDLLSNSYRLPDQSRVVLDYQSEISYPRYWWKREVSLKGDAYFEINKGRKFVVKTNYGQISVIGTRFQVEQLKNGIYIQCFEGTIKLSSNKSEQIIPEGNSIICRNNTIDKLKPITEHYPPLAKFNQHFSQASIQTITEEIANFFNVEIELKDTTLREHFSGSIYSTNCYSALDILCKSLGLTYKYNPKLEKYIIE